jgi:HAD superfamily hydrolase (TIGR01549 family)
MIKAVIFDFGQTLVDSADGFREAEKEAQDKLFKNLGLSNRENFLSIYRLLRREFHDRSDFSRRSLFNEVYYYYCLAADEKQLERWETEYWETVKAHTNIFPEAQAVLTTLNARYAVALITNTQGQRTSETHRINYFPELEKFFKLIVVAGEGEIPAKPDPEPFRRCLAKLEIAPSEAVYVGDDYRIDVCGAQAAGMHAVWIQHYSVNRSWPKVEATVPIITCLDQLLDIENMVSVL